MTRHLPSILLFLLLAASMNVFGQAAQTQCVQTLRQAQSKYENGRLHELPGLLEGCLNSGFNTEERRQAFKLLVQSYIYLEEPEEADAAMLNLLNTDHFFKPNPEVDPAEFVSLYNRFRTKPLFRVGATIGPSLNAPLATLDYSVGSASDGSATYAPGVTFFAGLVFEKDFFDERLTVAPEAVFALRKYSEDSDAFVEDAGGGKATDVLVDVKMSWIEFNPLAKWWLLKRPTDRHGVQRSTDRDGKIEPYIIGGPGINFVVAASLDAPNLIHDGGEGGNTGVPVDIKDCFKAVNYSAVVGAGFRWRLGGLYIVPDIRLHYGLNNVVDPSNRTNYEAALDYGWVPNDYRINSITFNIGIQYALFKPVKQRN